MSLPGLPAVVPSALRVRPEPRLALARAAPHWERVLQEVSAAASGLPPAASGLSAQVRCAVSLAPGLASI